MSVIKNLILGAVYLTYENDVFVAAQYYIPSDIIVPMSKWKQDQRTLNCWQCLEGKGKMCITADYSSMFQNTGSTNPGHGVCCKIDSEDGVCGGMDGQYQCSPPSFDEDPESEYVNVLSEGMINYQIMSFCPITNQQNCGLSDDSNNHDMEISVNDQKQNFGFDSAFYFDSQDKNQWSYDSCYYVLKQDEEMDQQILEDLKNNGDVMMYISFASTEGMNVYIYEGVARDTATTSIIDGNSQVETDTLYSVPYDSSILIVAYPDEGNDTNLQFSYWIGNYMEDSSGDDNQSKNLTGELLDAIGLGGPLDRNAILLIILILIGLALICIICCGLCCLYRKINSTQTQVQVQELVTRGKGANGENTNLEIEEGTGDTNRKLRQTPAKEGGELSVDNEKIHNKEQIESERKINETAREDNI